MEQYAKLLAVLDQRDKDITEDLWCLEKEDLDLHTRLLILEIMLDNGEDLEEI